MSKIFPTVAALLLSLAGAASHASPVYVNNAVDTLTTVSFSSGYVQIGDQLRLTAAGELDSLVTQFFNLGEAARFDATLTFYRADTLTQIGPSFTEQGISIDAGQSLNVAFSQLGGLSVPEEIVVMLSIGNLVGNGDLGLNLFDPPTWGSSSNQSFFVNTGAGLVEDSTFQGIDNVYFEINATTRSVPTPGTLWLVFGPAVAALRWRPRPLGQGTRVGQHPQGVEARAGLR